MTLKYPDTEGFAFDFSRAEIRLGRNIYTAFENVSHNQPIEEGVVFGAAAEPLKRTRGQLQIGEGSLEWSDFEEGMKFLEDLGEGWQEKVFTTTITYSAPGKKPIKVTLNGCRLLDAEFDHGQGADALPMSMPFSFMNRPLNGKNQLVNQRV